MAAPWRRPPPSDTPPRVLLLEDDVVLRDILLDLFRDEGMAVTQCTSLAGLCAAVAAQPGAVVVTDSWSETDTLALGPEQRAEIMALGRATAVILITGQGWARGTAPGEFGTSVIVLPKPFDVDRLLLLVRSGAAGRGGPDEGST